MKSRSPQHGRSSLRSARTALSVLVAACFAPAAFAQDSAAESASRAYSLAEMEVRIASTRSAPRRAHTFRLLRDRPATVALIDTGVNIAHNNLAGRLVDGAYNTITGTSDVTDSNGHGTLVASIITGRADPAGRGRDPLVLPIKIFNGPSTTEAQVNAGLAYSVGRAPIVNLSLAATGPVSESGMRASVDAGQLLVVAAGNRGLAHPDWPARYASESWANGQIIAVGAVDGSNVITSFSNRAGDARNNFLVAPGTSVIGASAFSNTGLAVGSGTSVAAPYVAGVAALVKAYWPQLSASQIANVLLATATDLGDPGTDAVYGRGLVNVTAALSPVGTMMVPLASGRAVPLASISFNPGPVAGQAVRAAAADGRLAGVSLDQFGRQFGYDLGLGIARAPSLTLDRVLGPTDRHFAFAEQALGNGGRLLVATDSFVAPAMGSLAAFDRRDRASEALGGLALTLPIAADREIAAGSLGLASTYFGFAEMGDRAASLALPALANPLFAFAPGHHHLGFGQSLGEGLKLKAGLVSTAGTQPLLGQFGLLERPVSRANAFVLEASMRFDRGFVALSGTQLDEYASYLGTTSAEAFALGRRPATTALTLSTAYALSPHWILAGQFTTASTPAYANDAASLVTGMQASRASAFGVALVKTATFSERDRLSVSVSQPLRAASGAMDFTLPVDVDAAGAVQYQRESVALKPSGRERVTELHYTRPIGKRASLGLAAVHRFQPNHDAQASAEKVVAIRWSLGF